MFINIAMFIVALLFAVEKYQEAQFGWASAFSMFAIFYASCVVVEIDRRLRPRDRKVER